MAEFPRVGRNDPCPCGSGRKYKKCHMPGDETSARSAEPASNTQHLREFAEEMRSPRLVARPYVSTKFDGRKVIGVRNQLMFVREDMTYADAIIEHLRQLLGERWLKIEAGQPIEQRHVVSRWLEELDAHIRATAKRLGVTSGPFAVTPTGSARALTVLADDLFQLAQAMEPPTELLNRIKTRSSFQASRYEIAGASLFARAGFGLKFIAPGGDPTPEFLARDKTTGDEVFLEAKSIYRAGVLHEGQKQEATDSISNRKRVIAKMHKAVKQNPGDRPFVTFIDLNRSGVGGMGLLENHFAFDVQRFLDRRSQQAVDGKCDVSAVALTNFGWHYQRDSEAASGGFFWFPSDNPRFPLSERTANMIGRALREYGWIPDEELHQQAVRSKYFG
jgi:hypothetical protein